MKTMLSLSTAVILILAADASAGPRNSSRVPPSIFNASPTILRNEIDLHQFTFRGGVVNDWPSRGAQWTEDRNAQAKGTFADASNSAALPNGCLVYACALAEQIRLRPRHGESQSRVITYRRSDGSGHAFVFFKSGSTYVAEDNSGNITPMPAFANRSSAEALYMAQTFQKRAAAGYSTPVQASFVGKF